MAKTHGLHSLADKRDFDMKKSPAFNRIAREAKAETGKFRNMIAVMKDLASWGPDEEGKRFSFEVVRDGGEFYLFGKYAAPLGKRESVRDHEGAVIVARIAGRRLEIGACDAYIGDRTPSEIIEGFRGFDDIVETYRVSDSADAVRQFAEDEMSDHPRFREAVQTGTKKAVDGIRARPVF